MGYIKDEIMEALTSLGETASELSSDEADRVRQELLLKFTENRETKHIWEYLKNAVGIQNPNAWRWVGEYVQGKQFLMLFNEDQDCSIFNFDHGTDIVAVLEECTGFEFYLTDLMTSFLLCFNHHDFLIATGAATEWLKNRANNNSN